MIDSYQRKIDYMRISVTDRCNLRCAYCMPEGIACIQHEEILRYEELLTICKEAVKLGIVNFKVTGGEPLVRKGCTEFIGALKKLEGVRTVTLTTNGILLKDALPALIEAGIDGVNISLDTTDREAYRRLTGYDSLQKVLDGMNACVEAGIRTKLNCVLLKGQEEEILKLARFAQEMPIDVRFIEMMPIGYGSLHKGISSSEARERLLTRYPDLHAVSQGKDSWSGNGPAVYENASELKGRIGWIRAVSHRFCDSCNRIRLTSTGILKPCLCYEDGVDLRAVLRDDALENQERLLQIRTRMEEAVFNKPKEHCFEETNRITEKRKMVQIGG